MSIKIYSKKDKNFMNENKSDIDNAFEDKCDKNNSSKENDEKNTLIQVLYSYEDFQKKNMNYGKTNPYKKKETQLSKVKKTIVKLFSSSEIGIQENNKNKKVDNLKFLTSRAAMWNEVEKNEDPDYNLKLESSAKKSLIDIILNYVNLLINDTLNDKKGMTYLASFMIVLSIIITCLSGFITVFNSTSSEQTDWKLNTTKNNYDDMNKLMNYIKIENENNNNLKFYELLQQLKNNMNENINSNYMNKKENVSLYELNINLENKLKEIEKKLIINTNEIDYFKANSKKEIENFKKKLQENHQLLHNKFKDYIKAIDTIKKNNNKDDFINDMEKKLSKNKIDIKNDVANKVEYEKRELLETINDLQKKIDWIETRISNNKLLKNEVNNLSESMKNDKDEEEYENVDKGIKKENENQTKQEKKKYTFWKSKEINVKDIQKELDVLKESTKKSNIFLDDIFPSFEQKILKYIENKIKYYLEIYKKDILNEITESKVIYNEEKYKSMVIKQEKMQSELLKTINNQIKVQSKIMKEDLSKSLVSIIEKKQLKKFDEYIPNINQVDNSSLEDLQKKVNELYNEFILDYNEIDWALESLGARIVYKMTSSPLNKNDLIEKFLNQIASFLPSEEIYGMIKPMGKDPSIILRPSNFPGDCFSFNGDKGKITIHLPATIDVTSISIQHVHENISNNSNATPKYFSVYGVVDLNWPEHFESHNINYNDFKNSSLFSCLHSTYGNIHSKEILDKWIKNNKKPNIIHIGDFYFDRKKRISNYPTKHCFPMKRIIFEFTENYGAPYTCIYRLKVHGKRCIRKFK
ncbi:conserved Plasmodium protein, unknown function [Plasmodium gallinaceum]|uniref:SUN domain-containing protein n=1 Tax=Plasmodium gallinaceum TaxID=5849 RepID=A0A1J1GZ42_PLAGA|nr:conserved Plasmodium protein, unknown function [Plasmodium gallinaceum]CRG97720.1 conserved Plasmodium protein, unknown function [Plasmodium gallinaceum]